MNSSKRRGAAATLSSPMRESANSWATDAMTEAHFDMTFDVNVKGTLYTVQKALQCRRIHHPHWLNRQHQRHPRARRLLCQ
jgi:hypothetical protein